MLAGRKRLEVPGGVVERVLVLVMDVPGVGNGADLGFVDLDVERADALIAPRPARPVVDPVMPPGAVRVAGEDDSLVGDPLGSHVHILSS